MRKLLKNLSLWYHHNNIIWLLDGLARQSHYGTEEFNLNAENLQLDFLNGTLPVWRHNITKLNWNGDYTWISYHCMCRQLEGRILRKLSRKPLQWRDLQGKLVKPGALFYCCYWFHSDFDAVLQLSFIIICIITINDFTLL